jgi:rhodanese-related sulfurtransferase
MGFFNFFGGGGDSGKIAEYLDKGAVIIDVRTPMEFDEGHVPGSVNIPLQQITARVAEIKKFNKSVIACCRSGARSGNATTFLNGKGIDTINGGPWQTVDSALKAKK